MDRYAFRAPATEDLDAVAEVLIADQLDDAGETTLDRGFLEGEWAKPGFDLAADAWVVVDEAGAIVAYGQTTHEESDVVDSWGVVHPARRARGIGSALLDRIEERAKARLADVRAPRFRHAVNAPDRAAAAMLEARGLRPIRHFWHMQIDLDAPFEPGAVPAGIAITGVTGDDIRSVHSVFHETLGDHSWRARPPDFERWAEEETGSPSYDPTLWLLATDAGTPVGALTASGFEDRGWISELGVLRSHRGRGIGAALLRRSFAMFAARRLPRVLLNVDAQNPSGATALYQRVGMRIVNAWDLWERAS